MDLECDQTAFSLRSAEIVPPPRIGFPHQLPQLCGEISPYDQVIGVPLGSQASADLLERHAPAATCQLKGSLYRVHIWLHV
jgi:hypothetical protein